MAILKFTFICALVATVSLCSAANLPVEVREGARRKTMTMSSTTTASVNTPEVTTTTGNPNNSDQLSSSIPQASSSSWTGQTLPPALAARSSEADYDGCYYNVEGVGRFKNKKVFTFSNGLPDGLYPSQYIVYDQYDGAPYNHVFDSKNVLSDGDFLNLIVPGETRKPNELPNQAISSAEICTTENNILYASVRTNAIFSQIPGTCHGNFFYLDDTQETDIEYLTDPNSAANNIHTNSAGGDPIPLWYSNQAIRSGSGASQKTGPAPWDVTAVHEYRIDWTQDFTAFYVDGQLQYKLTVNVPSKPGAWIWNNWANGDMNWSAGPPKRDNIMKIQDITMYYNTTNDSAAESC